MNSIFSRRWLSRRHVPETINVPGCPPHPDWIVWVIAQLVAGNAIDLDEYGRPQILFNETVHHNCPLGGTEEATGFGQEDRCLKITSLARPLA